MRKWRLFSLLYACVCLNLIGKLCIFWLLLSHFDLLSPLLLPTLEYLYTHLSSPSSFATSLCICTFFGAFLIQLYFYSSILKSLCSFSLCVCVCVCYDRPFTYFVHLHSCLPSSSSPLPALSSSPSLCTHFVSPVLHSLLSFLFPFFSPSFFLFSSPTSFFSPASSSLFGGISRVRLCTGRPVCFQRRFLPFFSCLSSVGFFLHCRTSIINNSFYLICYLTLF